MVLLLVLGWSLSEPESSPSQIYTSYNELSNFVNSLLEPITPPPLIPNRTVTGDPLTSICITPDQCFRLHPSDVNAATSVLTFSPITSAEAISIIQQSTNATYNKAESYLRALELQNPASGVNYLEEKGVPTADAVRIVASQKGLDPLGSLLLFFPDIANAANELGGTALPSFLFPNSTAEVFRLVTDLAGPEAAAVLQSFTLNATAVTDLVAYTLATGGDPTTFLESFVRLSNFSQDQVQVILQSFTPQQAARALAAIASLNDGDATQALALLAATAPVLQVLQRPVFGVNVTGVANGLNGLLPTNFGGFGVGGSDFSPESLTELPSFLSSPLPVPSMDLYITISNVLRTLLNLEPTIAISTGNAPLNASENANARSPPGTLSSGGFQVSAESIIDFLPYLNNLLFLGRLGVVSDEPMAEELVSYLNRTNALFNSVYHKTYATEEEALEDIPEHSTENRTWAILVFHSLAPGNVDYTIRMNYTTVPRTRRVVNRFVLGLDIDFQEYYTSGFLTLQHAVDSFVMNSPNMSVSATRNSTGTPPAVFRGADTLSILRNAIPALEALELEEAVAASVSAAANAANVTLGAISVPNTTAFLLGLLAPNLTSSALGDLLRFQLDGMSGLAASPNVAGLPGLANSDLLNALLSTVAPSDTVGIVGVPFPTDAYSSRLFYQVVGMLIGLIMCMSTLYPVSRLIKGIVEEKECRARETMKIMGLHSWVLWASWFVTYFVMSVFIALCVTLVQVGTFLPHTHAGMLFAFVLLFLCSEIAFAFLTSVFFSRAKLAGIVGPILLFSTVMPRYIFFGVDSGEGVASKTAACLLSPTAFAFGADILAEYEGANLGVSWDNLGEGQFSMQIVFRMLFLDFVLYMFLAWYLDNVLPSQYGQRKPLYFFLLPSYWSPSRSLRGLPSTHQDEEMGTVECEPFTEDEDHPVGLRIRGLRKVFPEGKKVAVDRLTFSMYEGQITALLGHNGAGKTTTISLLSGLLPVTDGDCEVYGRSIRTDMAHIRRSMGVCPQHNVLFSHLTVKEHLELYAALKGVPPASVQEAVCVKIKEVGLLDKSNVQSRALSGGMKRKLSVAIALIGDPKVVFLDEPTSGMDPFSRRATWELLRRSKAGRVIVLTTHFMDEADILGDRIAIMQHGKLRCIGSSLFLKSRFGMGYNLTMVQGEGNWDPQAIRNLVASNLPPDSFTSSTHGGELQFQLPFNIVSHFPKLFKVVEDSRASLGIGNYGVAMTTLEDVFVRIANEEAFETGEATGQVRLGTPASAAAVQVEVPTPPQSCSRASSPQGARAERAILSRTIRRQFVEVLRKRFLCMKRDRKGVFFEVFLPVVVVILVLLILTINFNPAGPSLELSAGAFATKKQPIAPVGVANAATDLTNFGLSWEFFSELPNMTQYLIDEHDSYLVSEYLLRTMQTTNEYRYGVYVFNDTSQNSFPLRLPFDLGLGRGKEMFNVSLQLPAEVTILHNSTSPHAFPIYAHELHRALYQTKLNNQEAIYRVHNHPLPLSFREGFQLKTVLALFAALFLLIPFCYLPATFSIFIVKERTVKAKHVQLVSGLSRRVYWFATYFWDLMNYLVIICLCMLVFAAYGNELFTGSTEKAGATFMVLFMYGVAVIPLSYCYSFMFDNHTAAQIGIASLHFLAGFVLVVASFIMSSLPETKDADAVLVQFWRFFPPFNFGDGLLSVARLDFENLVSAEQRSPFEFDVLGRPLLLMAIEAVVFMALALVIDSGFFAHNLTCRRSRVDITALGDDTDEVADIDVTTEATLVDAGAMDGQAVVIKGLRKVYPPRGNAGPKVAVRNLKLAVPAGQCFGFLGVNGAGKTTTMSILTGDFAATAGSATILGYDVTTQQALVRQHVGYCPQFDPLLDLMTAREHLMMFGRLRGVPDDELTTTTNDLLHQLGLDEFADRVAGGFSGGNKRKLSLGIALIGNPAVLFLDEPSTGMDPVARRFMWDVIAEISKSRSVVLTTHSMEECEALCSRVGIMMAGGLRCLGSVQHLKSRFSLGYHVEVKAHPSVLPSIKEFISTTFKDSELEEEHSGVLYYQMPMANLSLSAIFGTLEDNKTDLGITDYSVSQSTLEQIFISIAGTGDEMGARESPGKSLASVAPSPNVSPAKFPAQALIVSDALAGADGDESDNPPSARSEASASSQKALLARGGIVQ